MVVQSNPSYKQIWLDFFVNENMHAFGCESNVENFVLFSK